MGGDEQVERGTVWGRGGSGRRGDRSLRVGGDVLEIQYAGVQGLMRQTTIAQGRFSPWEGCKGNRSTLQNTIEVILVTE